MSSCIKQRFAFPKRHPKRNSAPQASKHMCLPNALRNRVNATQINTHATQRKPNSTTQQQATKATTNKKHEIASRSHQTHLSNTVRHETSPSIVKQHHASTNNIKAIPSNATGMHSVLKAIKKANETACEVSAFSIYVMKHIGNGCMGGWVYDSTVHNCVNHFVWPGAYISSFRTHPGGATDGRPFMGNLFMSGLV